VREACHEGASSRERGGRRQGAGVPSNRWVAVRLRAGRAGEGRVRRAVRRGPPARAAGRASTLPVRALGGVAPRSCRVGGRGRGVWVSGVGCVCGAGVRRAALDCPDRLPGARATRACQGDAPDRARMPAGRARGSFPRPLTIRSRPAGVLANRARQAEVLAIHRHRARGSRHSFPPEGRVAGLSAVSRGFRQPSSWRERLARNAGHPGPEGPHQTRRSPGRAPDKTCRPRRRTGWPATDRGAAPRSARTGRVEARSTARMADTQHAA
jgi:hypothetical protein